MRPLAAQNAVKVKTFARYNFEEGTIPMPHITEAEFKNRFVSIIMSSRDLPKKPLDLNILFVSAILGLKPDRQYSEKELNEELRLWTDVFGKNFILDHVTLRRYLIDEGYITRDPAGTTYQVSEAGILYTYDLSLRDLDLDTLLQEAKREREERKQKYMK